MFEQPTTSEWTQRKSRTDTCPPEPDRQRALAALGEDIGNQGQSGREDHRRAETHHAARRDQLPRRSGQSADSGCHAKECESGKQDAFAPDAVAETAGCQQQGREDEGVGVDDPLQRDRRGVQFAHERG